MLDELNPQQRQAVLYDKGNLLIVAGAGSGKTRTLVAKILYLISKGADPKRILAITFTNKAGNELKKRVKKNLGVKLPWSGTFHSICLRILRKTAKHVGLEPNFIILDEEESKKIFRNLLQSRFPNLEYEWNFYYQAVINYKEGNETFMYNDKSYHFKEITNFWEIFESYQEYLKENNLVDFSDLLYYTVKILKEKEKIRKKLSEHFQYILVDEYQDTNKIQYEFIKLLARNNVCVVGDPNQAIYEWRGAYPENILNFHKEFNPKVIKLEQNYRSKGVILAIANEIIKKCNPKWAKLIPILKSTKDWGEKPIQKAFNTPEEEAEWIAHKIKKLLNKGIPSKEIAILVRSAYLTETIEKIFIKEGIPYIIVGGVRFYERKEIKDLIALLRFLNNPMDLLALERILKIFFKKKAKKILKELEKYAYKKIEDKKPKQQSLPFSNSSSQIEESNFPNYLEALKKIIPYLPPEDKKILKSFIEGIEYALRKKEKFSDGLKKLIKAINYQSILKEEKNYEERWENVSYFLKLTENYEKKGKTLNDFLNFIFLMQNELEDKKNGVRIMTVHASKGLEFDTVFLPRLEEGTFPHYSAFDNEKELEEERRLFYVAITRAKNHLYLSYVTNKKTKPSRFLKEIPQHLITLESASIEKKEKNISFNYDRYSFKKENLSLTEGRLLTNHCENFYIGQKVKHPVFGLGTIINLNGRHAQVDFGGVVKKIHTGFLEKV